MPPAATEGPSGASVSATELRKHVSAALELRAAGRTDWLEEACSRRPDLREPVRVLVERAHKIPRLLEEGPQGDPRIGTVLDGRFRLIERIGAGAMGVVYLSEDKELRRRVACKVVRGGLMPPEQAFERFDREARSMAAVQHPSVAAIHDRGRTSDDQVFLVMEYIDGASLSDLLEAAAERARNGGSDACAWLEDVFRIASRGETSWLRTAVAWTAELALGLEAVHAAGVLHRDIKPSNVRVRHDGRPALLDFGIALLDDESTLTRAGTSLGTPCYLPPEALHRDRKRTPASDVYSLAATLYHLVTLQTPYAGSPTEVLAALAMRDPIPAQELRPGLPRDLQAILDKGLERDPRARYATAAEFAEDLRAFLEFRPVLARPISGVERAWRRVRRSRVALGASVAVLTLAALGLGGLGAHAWRERGLEQRRELLADVERRIPPNLGIVGVANRTMRHEADRLEVFALLDEGAEVALEPLPIHLLRAAFRFDHGDARGAAEDMALVASFVQSPFSSALAARYADAAASGSRAIELDALPEPGGAHDRYMLAYHELRRDRPARARALLADPEVRRIPHAEELFLLSTDFETLEIPDRRALALECYADLVRLESRLGSRTARTAHVAGRVLAVQARFDEALQACAEGIALAPRSYVLRINAGYSAFALRRFDEAREHLTLAREIRPNYAHIVEDLLWVEIADGRFDAAEQLVRTAEAELEPKSSTWFDYWSAVVATYAALDARARGDTRGVAAELGKARAAFARVPSRTHDKGSNKPKDFAFRIAEALAAEDERELVLALAQFLGKKPDNWWRRRILVAHLPKDLDAEGTRAVREVLEASEVDAVVHPHK